VSSATAFVSIMEGCSKYCSFCVVPYTRGEEVSRKGSEILEEARRLADSGVREITLLGQNVNAWHGRGENGESLRLGELLAMLSEIGGIERLRYTTSHPIDMDESLIAAHRDLPKLMPYLHLPVQSGSDRILKAMNRRHTREYYFEVVAKVRQACPHIALSGDFIAGFPGETEDDFAQTMDLIEKVGYAQSFSFKYSRRPGTPGADLAGQIDEDAKTQRLKQMQALLNRQHAQFNAGVLGKTFDILLERPGRGASQLIGRSPYLQPVIVDASAGKIGDIVKVRIIETGPLSLKAEPVS
jgi:tRNA-2-methylthio-N6-dimethylallyladenosine synthase